MWFVDSSGLLRRALVDSSGHLQIDILASPLEDLIGEVQAAPTTYTVLDRLKTVATLLAAGLPSTLDGGYLRVKEQSPLTEIDVDLVKVAGTAISLTKYVPVGVAYPAGTLIDPRDIRALTSSDVVTAVQGTASSLKVEIVQPSTKEDFQVVTSGADNIVIDKLTQGAYTPRRVTMSNHGAVATYGYIPATYRSGKFFQRGARGFINTVDCRCSDSGIGGGTFTVYLAPHPYGEVVASATITVPGGAGADWRSATFDIMWASDSLFVFMSASSDDMAVGEDSGTPYDRIRSTDSGATWYADDKRMWYRVIYKGQTIGEVTIGGGVSIVYGDRVLELDPVEPAVPTIEFEHHMVHEEKAFTAYVYDADVDAGEAAAKEVLITTPNTSARIHVKIQVTTTGAALFQLTENPTVEGGTPVTAYNNDRNSSETTTLTIKYDPTVTGDGTIIFQDRNPADVKGKIGGVARTFTEWILKQNEDYLIRVVSDGADNMVSIVIEFYEV